MFNISILDLLRTNNKRQTAPTLYYRIHLNLNDYIHSFEVSSRIRLTPKEVKAWSMGKKDIGIIAEKQRHALQTKFFQLIGSGIIDAIDLEAHLKQSLSKKKNIHQHEPDLKETLQNLINKYLERNNRLGDKTRSRYDFVRRQIVEFVDIRNYHLLDDLKPSLYYEFQVYLRNRLNPKGNPLSMGTVKGYMSKLMAVANDAVRFGDLKHHPFYKCSTKADPPERVALSEDELKRFIAIKTADDEFKLSICKDLFIFCCHSGLSFIDLQGLEKGQLQTTKDGRFIIKSRIKTKIVSRIPVTPTMDSIIRKYQDHPIVMETDTLLPAPCMDNYNEHLQLLRERAGIQKPITSHIARHTFACMYLENGGSLEVLAAILGHTSITTTQRYAKMQINRIGKEAANVYTKFPSLSKSKDYEKTNRPNQTITERARVLHHSELLKKHS